MTQGETLEEVWSNIIDAEKCWRKCIEKRRIDKMDEETKNILARKFIKEIEKPLKEANKQLKKRAKKNAADHRDSVDYLRNKNEELEKLMDVKQIQQDNERYKNCITEIRAFYDRHSAYGILGRHDFRELAEIINEYKSDENRDHVRIILCDNLDRAEKENEQYKKAIRLMATDIRETRLHVFDRPDAWQCKKNVASISDIVTEYLAKVSKGE